MDRTNYRRTALHLAVVKKQPAALTALIDLGADLNLKDAIGLPPLDQAALNGEGEMVRSLIDRGAVITLPAAIALELPDQIDRIVRANPDVLGPTHNRRWARLLGHASSRASGRVMETLLRTVMRHRAGLSIVNMEDDQETAVDGTAGYTPLHAAAFPLQQRGGRRSLEARGQSADARPHVSRSTTGRRLAGPRTATRRRW